MKKRARISACTAPLATARSTASASALRSPSLGPAFLSPESVVTMSETSSCRSSRSATASASRPTACASSYLP